MPVGRIRRKAEPRFVPISGVQPALRMEDSALTVGWPVPGRLANVQLLRTAQLRRPILVHLAPVGDPTRKTADGEQHSEHPRGEAHGLVDNTGIEIHVGVQLAIDEIVVCQRDGLKFLGDVEQVVLDAERPAGRSSCTPGARSPSGGCRPPCSSPARRNVPHLHRSHGSWPAW
jgi:hypothetical protein